MTIGALQILFKQEAACALGDDEIGEVGVSEEEKVEKVRPEESFGMPSLAEALKREAQIQNDATFTIIVRDSLEW